MLTSIKTEHESSEFFDGKSIEEKNRFGFDERSLRCFSEKWFNSFSFKQGSLLNF